MERTFLEELDIGDGAHLTEEAVEAIWQAHRQAMESVPVRFTAPMAGKSRPTREQIIKIPDRALRRAVIAENMKLFEGEN